VDNALRVLIPLIANDVIPLAATKIGVMLFSLSHSLTNGKRKVFQQYNRTSLNLATPFST